MNSRRKAILQLQLVQHCLEIEITGAYTSSVKALPGIEKLQPDLLFLDIEMLVMNGFELLEKILHLPFRYLLQHITNMLSKPSSLMLWIIW